MTNSEEHREKCRFCDGTGQISYFQGVSRFLLTHDECPECAGLGYVPEHGRENVTVQQCRRFGQADRRRREE